MLISVACTVAKDHVDVYGLYHAKVCGIADAGFYVNVFGSCCQQKLHGSP